MKKISFVLRSLNTEIGGGSHFNAIEQIRVLRELGYSVSVHTFTESGNKPPDDIVLIEHNLKNTFRNEQKNLANLMKSLEDSTDLFFLYGVDFIWGAGRYKKNGGCKIVAVYLDTYLPSMGILSEHNYLHRCKRFFWDKTVGLWLASSVDCFFAVSPWLKKEYVSFGFNEKRFKIFPNFLWVSRHVSSNKRSSEKAQLLYCGRVTYDKGIDLLISAISENKEFCELTIVGAGDMLDRCKMLVDKHELTDQVFFVPWVGQDKLSDFYNNADIFVHPARWPEPFGRTIVEALSHALPVVVPKNGACAWIAGDAGFVFENGNQKELSLVLRSAMKEAVSNKDILQKAAIARANIFNKEEGVKVLENLLEEILYVS